MADIAPIAAACLWLIVANLRAMFPSRDHLWRFAYVSIAFGLPIAIWLFVQNGPLFALAFLVAAASMLRWPLIYLWRWITRR